MFNKKLILCAFLVASNAVFGMQRPPKPLEYHPLLAPGQMEVLCGLAIEILKALEERFAGKKQVIVAVGQTPAYIMEMMSELDKKMYQGHPEYRCPREYKHLAFTGSFFKPDGRHGFLGDMTLKNTIEKQEPFYWKYLESVGLSAKDIESQDAVFIFMDFCLSGKGLRSFMHLLRNHNLEKVCYMYLFNQKHTSLPLDFCVPNRRMGIGLEADNGYLIDLMGDADACDDRIVPHFQCSDWDSINPLTFQLSSNAQAMLSKIRLFFEDHPERALLETGPLIYQKAALVSITPMEILALMVLIDRDKIKELADALKVYKFLLIDHKELFQYATRCGKYQSLPVLSPYIDDIRSVVVEGQPVFEYAEKIDPALAQTLRECREAKLQTMCAVCAESKKELMKCSQCKRVFYCSKDCQKADWSAHKKICKKQ